MQTIVCIHSDVCVYVLKMYTYVIINMKSIKSFYSVNKTVHLKMERMNEMSFCSVKCNLSFKNYEGLTRKINK